MVVQYVSFAIAVCFSSWIVGIVLIQPVVKNVFYERLSHLNFIKSPKLNRLIGIDLFRWMVKHTFFRFFNQKIKIERGNADLLAIRWEMSYAEISHLIAFVFVVPFAIYQGITKDLIFALVILFFNSLLNLYPSLLQQENKRRLDRLIARKTY